MSCLQHLRVAVAAAFALAAGEALAACSIANKPVSLSFGSYTPIAFAGKITSANVDSSGTVSISCTGLAIGITYTIKLNAGYSNNILARSMSGTGGGANMNYNLYTDASRTTVWGDGTNGASFSGTITPLSGVISHPFYGRIPAGQSSLRAGTFTDQLVITFEFLL